MGACETQKSVKTTNVCYDSISSFIFLIVEIPELRSWGTECTADVQPTLPPQKGAVCTLLRCLTKHLGVDQWDNRKWYAHYILCACVGQHLFQLPYLPSELSHPQNPATLVLLTWQQATQWISASKDRCSFTQQHGVQQCGTKVIPKSRSRVKKFNSLFCKAKQVICLTTHPHPHLSPPPEKFCLSKQ